MNRIGIALFCLALASSAFGGGNPDARIYIDFDPPNYVHEIWPAPAPYTEFDAYVCMDHLPSGLTGVSFSLTDLVAEYPDVVATQSWVHLLPGGLHICIPWSGTTESSTECMTDDEGPVLIGYVRYLCVGTGPACLQILDHPEYPRWVVDCAEPGQVDYYCVLAHGSIGGSASPEGDCGAVPAEAQTWGTIKSLYK